MTAQEREATILRLQPVVRRIALAESRRIPRVELDDLISDGYLGLIVAVDTYEPERGMSLDRYARRKILYAMLDGVRRNDCASQLARRVLKSAETDRYSFAVRVGRMPSRRELEQRHPRLR